MRCTQKKVNKVALSSNDDKRLQTFDRVTRQPHGTNTFKMCKSEMMIVKDLFFKKNIMKQSLQQQ